MIGESFIAEMIREDPALKAKLKAKIEKAIDGVDISLQITEAISSAIDSYTTCDIIEEILCEVAEPLFRKYFDRELRKRLGIEKEKTNGFYRKSNIFSGRNFTRTG